ncbi:MAG: Ppx/GppA family phosphatase [Deltaproteobacteria bacterium]|nr:Ppx/GppA family phosphatase [Deltaproteobacteria bacterium]
MTEITLKRYAAIDIGSNTILLLIGQITHQGSLEVVIDCGETSRLGSGLYRGGRLNTVSVKKSIIALKHFYSLCQKEGVSEIACVGTNALRLATDTNKFIRKIQKECNIYPVIISEEEEARFSYLSVQKDPFMPKDAVVMDVGGGSTEYIFRRGESSPDQLEMLSLPLGAVRLTEEFVHTDPPSRDACLKLQDEIDKVSREIPPILPGAIIGIGGTAVTLGAIHLGLDSFDGEKIHALHLTVDEMGDQVKKLQEKDLIARKKVKGLPPDRADIILAGAMIILATMERLHKDVLHISSHGLRYGLFYQRFMGGHENVR